MSKGLGKIIRRMLVLLLVLFVLMLTSCMASLLYLSLQPSVPKDYTSSVRTGGEIEAHYLRMGEHKTALRTVKVGGKMEKIYIHYPKDMTEGEESYPLVMVANGTGVKAKKYPSLFEHLASWGYIVVGNDDPGTWDGKSTEECLEYILEENRNPGSIFFGHVDEENIGITGHSQGGVAVFSAITNTPHASSYKAAVSLSPVHPELAEALGWPYDLGLVQCPIILFAGTGEVDSSTITPREKLEEMFAQLAPHKVMARRSGVDHGEMLYTADGYVTAWFQWLLKGDEYAGKAFLGPDAELLGNARYVDQAISL